MIDDSILRLRTDRSAVTRLEIGSIVHVARPLVADLFATFCFYAVYAATGYMGAATVVAAGVGIGQVAWLAASGRRVPALQWASLVLVIAVGGLAFLTGDVRYVLYKAGIIYLAIGLAMLRRGWLFRYVPPIAETYLPRRAIVAFGYMWSALLLVTGVMSIVLTRTEPARLVALVMGVWGPASKIALLTGQYLAGRVVVRRAVVAALGEADAAAISGA